MAKKTKRKKNSGGVWKAIFRDKKTLLWLILAPVLWIGFLILGSSPALQGLRDSKAYILICKAIISLVILVVAFYPKMQRPFGMGLMIAMACLPWVVVAIPSQRALLIAETLLTPIALGYLLYENIKYRKSNLPLLLTTMFMLVLSVLEGADAYTYLHNPGSLRYWIVSLIATLLLTPIAAVLVFKGIWYLKDDRTSEKVCICIMVAFFVFVLTEFSLGNANYMFDTSTPVVYQLTIAEKEIDTHSKSADDYLFIVRHGEQALELEVSQSEYYRYEVGDTIPVTLYEGFLKDPYYIAELP